MKSVSKRLSTILLALGLAASVGCSQLQTLTTMQSNCPPIVPTLPGLNPDGQTVTLHPEHQRELLIYFEEVNRCGL